MECSTDTTERTMQRIVAVTMSLAILTACGGGGGSPAPAVNQPAAGSAAAPPPPAEEDPPPPGGEPPPPAQEPLPPAQEPPPSAEEPPPSAEEPPPSAEEPPLPPVEEPPPTNMPPAIGGTPPPEVEVGSTYLFVAEASDPDGDDLTFTIENRPRWADFSTMDGALSGTPRAGDEGTYENITIVVSDGELSDFLEFGITVEQISSGSVTLSWTPPTRNTDGTALTDLAGYKLYYGNQPGDYPNMIDVPNPGLSSYVVENLPLGTWYFVATAYDMEGFESDFSNEASEQIP